MKYIIDIPNEMVIKSPLKGLTLGIAMIETSTQKQFIIPTNIPLISYIEPQKWIPVSERPPEYEMDVLLQFTSNMCVGFFHPSESWIIWSGGDWCTGVLEGDEEPIAWMPLPEPWKEGNNEVE